MDDLYDTLGVAADATPEQIKKAGRKRQKQTHPDAGGNREEFESVQRALTVLLDPAKRSHYDRTGEAKEGSGEAAEQAEARLVLSQTLDAVMAGGEPQYVDLAKGVMGKMVELRNMLVDNRNQGATETTKQVTRLERYMKRLKKKTPGPSVLTEMLQGQIDALKRAKAAGEAGIDHKIRVIDLAMTMADGHESEVDPGGDMNELARYILDNGGLGGGLGGMRNRGRGGWF